jgi:hypothetical protein
MFGSPDRDLLTISVDRSDRSEELDTHAETLQIGMVARRTIVVVGDQASVATISSSGKQ